MERCRGFELEPRALAPNSEVLGCGGGEKIKNPAARRSSTGVSSQILLLEYGIKLLINNNFYMVPGRGLEPPRCYSLVPETSASTNSATRAGEEGRAMYARGRELSIERA